MNEDTLRLAPHEIVPGDRLVQMNSDLGQYWCEVISVEKRRVQRITTYQFVLANAAVFHLTPRTKVRVQRDRVKK